MSNAYDVDGSNIVLVTWPDFPSEESTLGRRLRHAGLVLRRAPKLGPRSAEEIIALANDCAAVIASTDPFSARVLDALPYLRVIARVGIGTDSIDLAAATARDIIVTAARGTNEDAVADHTVGLMLSALRRTVALDSSVRSGRWERTGVFAGSDLHGKTVGLIGLGAIATLVAKRLTGFDVRVLGYDPALRSHPSVQRVELADVLRQSDVVSVHVPLSSGTHNLIDAHAIRTMKDGAVLVNTSRGGVVDESSLAQALAEGRLAAAALDVFAEEPPVGNPLLRLRDRTVLTPHIAGLSRESIAVMMRHATDAVVDTLTGRQPRDVLNPEAISSQARGDIGSSPPTTLRKELDHG